MATAPNSSTAGYLAPSSESIQDEALDAVLQGAIKEITGIPGKLVRPRWQPEPPTQPDFSIDWCAFGIPRFESDVMPYKRFDPTANGGQGAEIVERDEIIYVLHSFYGPRAGQMAARLRAGLDVDQNRATLKQQGVVLVEVQGSVQLPALLKDKYVKRIDMTVVYRWRPSTTYAVFNLQSAALGLDNERYVTPIVISPPN